MSLRDTIVAVTFGLVLVGGAFPSSAEVLCSGPMHPVYPVTVTKVGAEAARLGWYVQDESYTDIVRGSLNALAAMRGDFRTATIACIKEDDPSEYQTSFDDPDVPGPGEGFWYLLRADSNTAGCPVGQGTYDSPFGNQVGYRDLEIMQSGHDCNCYYREGPCTTVPQ